MKILLLRENTNVALNSCEKTLEKQRKNIFSILVSFYAKQHIISRRNLSLKKQKEKTKLWSQLLKGESMRSNPLKVSYSNTKLD